ncbi:hypothetical protein IE53DRAFT_89268 [Violaceomyces palustris]|uniref:Uncharacterized protein n=1 Tax=Violaceomyces palustris TaxID=1673888 RepID=A0ACD0NXG7_9BASI|nr:hypothetical protein IE53DRAFT_89268 [Violaceomyces palustris]
MGQSQSSTYHPSAVGPHDPQEVEGKGPDPKPASRSGGVPSSSSLSPRSLSKSFRWKDKKTAEPHQESSEIAYKQLDPLNEQHAFTGPIRHRPRPYEYADAGTTLSPAELQPKEPLVDVFEASQSDRRIASRRASATPRDPSILEEALKVGLSSGRLKFEEGDRVNQEQPTRPPSSGAHQDEEQRQGLPSVLVPAILTANSGSTELDPVISSFDEVAGIFSDPENNSLGGDDRDIDDGFPPSRSAPYPVPALDGASYWDSQWEDTRQSSALELSRPASGMHGFIGGREVSRFSFSSRESAASRSDAELAVQFNYESPQAAVRLSIPPSGDNSARRGSRSGEVVRGLNIQDVDFSQSMRGYLHAPVGSAAPVAHREASLASIMSAAAASSNCDPQLDDSGDGGVRSVGLREEQTVPLGFRKPAVGRVSLDDQVRGDRVSGLQATFESTIPVRFSLSGLAIPESPSTKTVSTDLVAEIEALRAGPTAKVYREDAQMIFSEEAEDLSRRPRTFSLMDKLRGRKRGVSESSPKPSPDGGPASSATGSGIGKNQFGALSSRHNQPDTRDLPFAYISSSGGGGGGGSFDLASTQARLQDSAKSPASAASAKPHSRPASAMSAYSSASNQRFDPGEDPTLGRSPRGTSSVREESRIRTRGADHSWWRPNVLHRKSPSVPVTRSKASDESSAAPRRSSQARRHDLSLGPGDLRWIDVDADVDEAVNSASSSERRGLQNRSPRSELAGESAKRRREGGWIWPRRHHSMKASAKSVPKATSNPAEGQLTSSGSSLETLGIARTVIIPETELEIAGSAPPLAPIDDGNGTIESPVIFGSSTFSSLAPPKGPEPVPPLRRLRRPSLKKQNSPIGSLLQSSVSAPTSEFPRASEGLEREPNTLNDTNRKDEDVSLSITQADRRIRSTGLQASEPVHDLDSSASGRVFSRSSAEEILLSDREADVERSISLSHQRASSPAPLFEGDVDESFPDLPSPWSQGGLAAKGTTWPRSVRSKIPSATLSTLQETESTSTISRGPFPIETDTQRLDPAPAPAPVARRSEQISRDPGSREVEESPWSDTKNSATHVGASFHPALSRPAPDLAQALPLEPSHVNPQLSRQSIRGFVTRTGALGLGKSAGDSTATGLLASITEKNQVSTSARPAIPREMISQTGSLKASKAIVGNATGPPTSRSATQAYYEPNLTLDLTGEAQAMASAPWTAEVTALASKASAPRGYAVPQNATLDQRAFRQIVSNPDGNRLGLANRTWSEPTAVQSFTRDSSNDHAVGNLVSGLDAEETGEVAPYADTGVQASLDALAALESSGDDRRTILARERLFGIREGSSYLDYMMSSPKVDSRTSLAPSISEGVPEFVGYGSRSRRRAVPYTTARNARSSDDLSISSKGARRASSRKKKGKSALGRETRGWEGTGMATVSSASFADTSGAAPESDGANTALRRARAEHRRRTNQKHHSGERGKQDDVEQLPPRFEKAPALPHSWKPQEGPDGLRRESASFHTFPRSMERRVTSIHELERRVPSVHITPPLDRQPSWMYGSRDTNDDAARQEIPTLSSTDWEETMFASLRKRREARDDTAGLPGLAPTRYVDTPAFAWTVGSKLLTESVGEGSRRFSLPQDYDESLEGDTGHGPTSEEGAEVMDKTNAPRSRLEAAAPAREGNKSRRKPLGSKNRSGDDPSSRSSKRRDDQYETYGRRSYKLEATTYPTLTPDRRPTRDDQGSTDHPSKTTAGARSRKSSTVMTTRKSKRSNRPSKRGYNGEDILAWQAGLDLGGGDEDE